MSSGLILARYWLITISGNWDNAIAAPLAEAVSRFAIMWHKLLAIFLLTASSGSALTSTWTGAGDGTSFQDPGNWDNGVPDFDDTAIFGSNADNVTIHLNTTPVFLANLQFQGVTTTGPILFGDEDLQISNYFYVEGGRITGTIPGNSITFDSLSSIDLVGNDEFVVLFHDIQNFGDMVVQNNTFTLSNSTFYNYNNLTFEGGSGFNGGSGVFNNIGGVLSRETNPGQTAIGWDVFNSGYVFVESGEFLFNGNFTQNGGVLAVKNGQTISFSLGTDFINGGEIIGTGIIHNATASPLEIFSHIIDPMGNPDDHVEFGIPQTPGKLTFLGDMTFEGGNVFYFDIFGPGAGNYDQVVFVSGMATFIDMPYVALYGDSSLPGLLTPADVFTIFAGNYTGDLFYTDGDLIHIFDFETFELLGTFEIDYLPTEIRLINFQPVPEPQTWAMLGLGAAVIGLWGWRRRRA